MHHSERSELVGILYCDKSRRSTPGLPARSRIVYIAVVDYLTSTSTPRARKEREMNQENEFPHRDQSGPLI